MIDGLPVRQVDNCDLVGGEEDTVMSVCSQGADGEAFTAEGIRHPPQLQLSLE